MARDTAAARRGGPRRDSRPPGPHARTFSVADLVGLPDAVGRYLASLIDPGTPVDHAARIEMHGHLKLGRWIPFTAVEVLDPRRGFCWSARLARGLITGADRYIAGAAAMDWRLLGVVPVVRARGPDIARSSAARVGGESIWLPTSLLPRQGVRWEAAADDTLLASFSVDDVAIALTHHLDTDGRLQSIALDRWGDPDRTGTWAWHRFGGHVGEHRTFDGITIPTVGRIGWHVGTDRWLDGEFFRHTITDLALGPFCADETFGAAR